MSGRKTNKKSTTAGMTAANPARKGPEKRSSFRGRTGLTPEPAGGASEPPKRITTRSLSAKAPGGSALTPIEEDASQELADIIENNEVEQELGVADNQPLGMANGPKGIVRVDAVRMPERRADKDLEGFDLGEDMYPLNEPTIELEDTPYIAPEDEDSSSSSGKEESDEEPETPKPSKRTAPASKARREMPVLASTAKGKGPVGSPEFRINVAISGLDKCIHVESVPSTATIARLEVVIRDLLDEPDSPLGLSYQTAWGNKSMKFALDDQNTWKRVIEEVGAKIRASRGKFSGIHHIQVFHFLDEEGKATGKKSKAAAKTESAKKIEQTKNSSYTRQIIEKHACPAKIHAHECYVPTRDDGVSVPADMIGKCIQIPITMQATWAAECSSIGYGPAEVPLKYKKQLIHDAVEGNKKKAMAAATAATFQRVPPKARGMTGSSPALASELSSDPDYLNQQPISHPVHPWPGMYGGLPSIIIQNGTLDSPTKRALGMSAPRAESQIHSNMDEGMDLADWLPELDAKFGKGNTPYSDCLGSLTEHGIESIRDITRCQIAALTRYAGCKEGFAMRLREKADFALGIVRK